MIETTTLPILMKAIDFLFEEGKKILEERRERRKVYSEKQDEEKDNQQTIPSGAMEVDIIGSRETALNSLVTEVEWRNNEAKVKHLLILLETHIKNYYIVKEQYAKFGSALVPLIIVNQLSEAEEEIAKTTQELEEILARIYKRKVVVFDDSVKTKPKD